MPTYPRPECRSLEYAFAGRDIALVTDCYTFHSCRDIRAEPKPGSRYLAHREANETRHLGHGKQAAQSVRPEPVEG